MQIFVKLKDNTITVEVESDYIVEKMKAKIHEVVQYPPYQQILVFNGRELREDGRTLAYYNITNGSTLHLVARLIGFQSPIYVKTSTWKIITVKFSDKDTIYEIKSQVEEEEGIPLHKQVLLFAGKELEDDRTLVHYRIDVGATLHLVESSDGISCKSQGDPLSYSLPVEKVSDIIFPQTKRARAASHTTPSKATPDRRSILDILDTNDGKLCADCQTMSDQNYEAMLKLVARHQAKATSTLGVLMSKLEDRPSSSVSTKLEALKHELAAAQCKKKQADATISKLTYKNKVTSARCASYERQLVALEAENKKMKELLMVANQKNSEARAAGYAEGLEKFPSTEQGQTLFKKFWEDEKAKWLKSVDFLDRLTEGALQYFDYGFDSCQKQVEKQGFVGRLNKDAALQNAPELEEVVLY